MRAWKVLFCIMAIVSLGCGDTPPPATPNSPFQRTEVAGLGDPEVVIANLAGRPIRVSVDGPTNAVLEVGTGETKQAKVKPGDYRYRAEARGASPFDGTQNFQPDGRYT